MIYFCIPGVFDGIWIFWGMNFEGWKRALTQEEEKWLNGAEEAAIISLEAPVKLYPTWNSSWREGSRYRPNISILFWCSIVSLCYQAETKRNSHPGTTLRFDDCHCGNPIASPHNCSANFFTSPSIFLWANNRPDDLSNSSWDLRAKLNFWLLTFNSPNLTFWVNQMKLFYSF